MTDVLTVRCACGWQTNGTDDAVVAATTAHGLRLHNMAATREQILAMAIPAPAPFPPDGSSSSRGATNDRRSTP